MYYYVYETTIAIDNIHLKYYGSHGHWSISSIQNHYIGSGSLLHNLIVKHGIEVVNLKYLKFFNSQYDARVFEQKLIRKALKKYGMYKNGGRCLNLTEQTYIKNSSRKENGSISLVEVFSVKKSVVDFIKSKSRSAKNLKYKKY
ncbi:hypothetical protein QTO12_05935 [Vibrio owensii]|uniref:hypothetical protein n=1 Tax=Vibrio owensii TaxID=696485 RepID=UPI002F3EEFA6